MKRLIAILLAAMTLTGALTACSGTMGMNDRGMYGSAGNTTNGYTDSYRHGSGTGTGMTGGQ